MSSFAQGHTARAFSAVPIFMSCNPFSLAACGSALSGLIHIVRWEDQTPHSNMAAKEGIERGTPERDIQLELRKVWGLPSEQERQIKIGTEGMGYKSGGWDPSQKAMRHLDTERGRGWGWSP